MKLNHFIGSIIILVFAGCVKDDLVAPSAEYDLQTFDNVASAYVNLPKPYELKANVAYRLISQNSTEYNSFYQGDTILIGKRKVYHVYSEVPNNEYQGVVVQYDPALKKSTLIVTYTKPGIYTPTFVAVAVGNKGEDIAFSVNSKNQITVIP
jgi:hypothetical protein